MDFAPPRGTRDFYPDQMRLRTWLFGHFHAVARMFGFELFDAPVLESEELFTRKAGEEIVEQLYTLTDKGERRLALRPEMTPSLARMVLQKGGSLALPLKWYSIPQCWRYERMTRGRRREHYQWNMDVFGVSGVTAEVELLAALVTFFQRVGLSAADVGIKVSNRKLLQAVLERLGVPADRLAPVCVLIDKLEKVPREAIMADMAALGLDEGKVDRVVEMTSFRELEPVAAFLGENHEGVQEISELWRLGEAYGLHQWLSFDASLVRGLAYYTGVVFEAFSRDVSLRALCGGGRYDHLLSTFGGKDVPACGFGFGDAVIIELLEERHLLPDLQPELDDVVFPFGPDLRGPAMQVARRLREQGRSVDLILEEKKVKWAFRRADQSGARRMVLIAPDEWAGGQVRVKDLDTGDERDIPLEQL